MWMIGPDDDFKMTVPDIRMPPNQLWPLHWHNEWIAVVALDGLCSVGDTPMTRGDVLISRENVEYGPVLSGPKGSQILEVFARARFGGGYAAEYHDHPTLQNLEQRALFGPTSALPPMDGDPIQFAERPAGSERNAGHQMMRNEGADGIWLGRLGPGGQKWDLGESDDPNRGVMLDTRLMPRQVLPRHHHDDARWILVFEGSMRVAGRELALDDVLVVEGGHEIPAFEAGPEGVALLELVRTAKGVTTTVAAEDRHDDLRGAVPDIRFV